MASTCDNMSKNDQSSSSPTNTAPTPPARVDKTGKHGAHDDFTRKFMSSNTNELVMSDKAKAAADELANLFDDQEDEQEEAQKPQEPVYNKNSEKDNSISSGGGSTETSNEISGYSKSSNSAEQVQRASVKSKKSPTTPPSNKNGTGLTTPLTAAAQSLNSSVSNAGEVIAGSTHGLSSSDLTSVSSSSSQGNNKLSKTNTSSVTAASGAAHSMTSQVLFQAPTGVSLNENILTQIMANPSANQPQQQQQQQQQQSNYSNVNYLMRRERSLDRAPATENFIENFLLAPSANMRRSYIVGSSHQTAAPTNQSPSQQVSNPLYGNSINLQTS